MKQIVPAPVTQILPSDNNSELGKHLTDQYHRATGAMAEVLKFGAMMMILRDHLANNSTRGVVRTGGAKAKDTGIKGWLKEFAPEIKEPTAYRFLHVAEVVAKEFVLPGKISFPELATKPPETLPPALAKKQSELWDFVNGTSQRSWLDRFKPDGLKGGKRDSKKPALTPEQEHQAKIDAMHADCKSVGEGIKLLIDSNAYRVLSDAEMEGLIDLAAALLDAASEWHKTPKTKRAALTLNVA